MVFGLHRVAIEGAPKHPATGRLPCKRTCRVRDRHQYRAIEGDQDERRNLLTWADLVELRDSILTVGVVRKCNTHR